VRKTLVDEHGDFVKEVVAMVAAQLMEAEITEQIGAGRGEPEPTDNEIAAGGAHVFLEPTVAEILDDKVLDASVESGRVQFTLFERGTPESSQDSGPPA
jgi:hypothetical protein